MLASVWTAVISPSWLWVWEWVEFISIIVIGSGCWGEGWAEHHRFSDNLEKKLPASKVQSRWKVRFWKMVVGGLAIELIAFGLAFIASNREIEELHKSNLELQAKLNPRTITLEQITNFIYSTELIRKIPIKICIGQEGSDTETFAYDLREMFTLAKFPVDSSAGVWGITRDPNFISTRPIGYTNEYPDVWLVYYSTNNWEKEQKIPHRFHIKANYFPFSTNMQPMVLENDPQELFDAIYFTLKQTHIKVETTPDTYWVKTNGEFALLVPIRNQ